MQRLVAEQNFVKARTTVDDYFVRVSESHLLKAAGLQPLRRELLEAALKFYEELTQQRSNDPLLVPGPNGTLIPEPVVAIR